MQRRASRCTPSTLGAKASGEQAGVKSADNGEKRWRSQTWSRPAGGCKWMLFRVVVCSGPSLHQPHVLLGEPLGLLPGASDEPEVSFDKPCTVCLVC
jgi:hypothetical protein